VHWLFEVFHVGRGENKKLKAQRGQHLFVVNIEDYAYLVPFVEEQKQVVLKTIIPSRKATKKYLHTETKKR
jgi:hypothetical protein